MNNPNPRTLSNVSIQDILPTGFNYTANTAKLNNVDINATQITITASNLNISLGNMPANTSWIVKYQVAVTSGAPIGNAINKAIATSDTATSTQSQAIVVVRAPVIVVPTKPLVLTKQANLTTVKVGDTVRFTLTVSNPNATSISNAVLNDILPQGLIYNIGSAKYKSNPITAITSNGLSFSLGNLPADSISTLVYETVVDNAAPGSELINQATITANDTKANSNTAKATVTLLNDSINISKKADTATSKYWRYCYLHSHFK